MARTQIALTPEVHRALVSWTAQLTGLAEHRITQSDAVLAAITVARAHPDEAGAALAADHDGS